MPSQQKYGFNFFLKSVLISVPATESRVLGLGNRTCLKNQLSILVFHPTHPSPTLHTCTLAVHAHTFRYTHPNAHTRTLAHTCTHSHTHFAVKVCCALTI